MECATFIGLLGVFPNISDRKRPSGLWDVRQIFGILQKKRVQSERSVKNKLVGEPPWDGNTGREPLNSPPTFCYLVPQGALFIPDFPSNRFLCNVSVRLLILISCKRGRGWERREWEYDEKKWGKKDESSGNENCCASERRRNWIFAHKKVIRTNLATSNCGLILQRMVKRLK